MDNINRPIEKVLISEEQIKSRIDEMAKEIDRDYKGREPLMLSVLSGSFMLPQATATELFRAEMLIFIREKVLILKEGI